MNAIDFIKHYGLNTAIRITEDSKNDDFWDTETGFYTDKNSESCVCLSDLKRLVESVEVMKSEFESREAFECIFGDKGEIDLSKDETGEYSFQPSRFAYSFFLLAWQYRQTEVDALTLQVAEMKSRLNDAYTNGQSAMYTARQSKIDELQKQLIEQGQRFNTQSQQIASLKKQLERLGYTDNGGELMKPPIGDAPKFDLLNELQKRVDAVKALIEEYRDPPTEDKTFQHALSIVAYELEQALKGESNQ